MKSKSVSSLVPFFIFATATAFTSDSTSLLAEEPATTSQPSQLLATANISSGSFKAPKLDFSSEQIAATANAAGTRTEAEKSLQPLGAITSELSGGTIVANATGTQIEIRQAPSDTAKVVNTLSNPNANGGPLVFQAVSKPNTSGWIRVMLPTRPNGSTGWVKTTEVTLAQNPFRIEVDADNKSLTVFRQNSVFLETSIGIGAEETPTPAGAYFLTELLKTPDPTGIYGPYAFGLSAHSNHLTLYNGGSGTIGLHGTDQPDQLGGRPSHGCIRISNETISELAEFIPLGTPILISGTQTSPGKSV